MVLKAYAAEGLLFYIVIILAECSTTVNGMDIVRSSELPIPAMERTVNRLRGEDLCYLDM